MSTASTRRSASWLLVALAAAAAVGVHGAGDANVVAATLQWQSAGRVRAAVTVQHSDRGWRDYADGWSLVDADSGALLTTRAGAQQGFTRLLRHPHVEQPFTRAQSDILIPPETKRIVVRAHDMIDGYGGAELVINRDQIAPAAVSANNFARRRLLAMPTESTTHYGSIFLLPVLIVGLLLTGILSIMCCAGGESEEEAAARKQAEAAARHKPPEEKRNPLLDKTWGLAAVPNDQSNEEKLEALKAQKKELDVALAIEEKKKVSLEGLAGTFASMGSSGEASPIEKEVADCKQAIAIFETALATIEADKKSLSGGGGSDKKRNKKGRKRDEDPDADADKAGEVDGDADADGDKKKSRRRHRSSGKGEHKSHKRRHKRKRKHKRHKKSAD